MTDSINKVKIDGRNRFEIVGSIDVIRVIYPDGDDREFHLELDIDDALADQLIKYGSEGFNEVDLLSSGIRAGLTERYARKQAG